jgi:hypothetical protein
MTLQASVGELVQIQFPAFDIDGITPLSGLLDSDFSKLLIVDNIVSAQITTVAEVGSTGRYVLSFTPNANGLWYAEVETPVEDIFADQVEVGPPPTDWIDAIVTGVWSEILAGSYPANSAGWRLARVDDTAVNIYSISQNIDSNVQDIHEALIMAVLAATGGGVDGVETNATQADGFYDGLTVVVRNSSGNVSRRIASYVQADGVFYFDDDLPFVPAPGDEVIVLGVLGKVLCENSADMLDKLIEVWQRLGLDPENPLCITKSAQEANGWRLVHTEVGDKLIVTREDV